ncbi:MAG TPA: IS1 family transposase [Casimicrobiaceae bacterium]|nr:IS1 family transposase [Casimicrobiaceae bacterium]
MNQLSVADRAKILTLLVEGNSINATCRITGAAKNTVLKLLADVGEACVAYQDRVMRNLKCKKLQCDEIWAFCYSKQRSVPRNKRRVHGAGDVYTWTAIDAETKLIPCWHIGTRDGESAKAFIDDLAPRMATRVQLTTDGLKAYLAPVEYAFGANVDYAMLVKLYGPAPGSAQERRYSPAECCGSIKGTVCGNPKESDISTSHVERANLTMRMGMRRFTRLTNGFSKKLENHMHAVSLHFMHYNFCRIHKTLRVTPAMEAKIDDHVWTMEEVVMMADTNSPSD